MEGLLKIPVKGGLLETRFVVVKDGSFLLYNIGLRRMNPLIDRPEFTTSLDAMLEIKVHDFTGKDYPFTVYFRDAVSGRKISLSFLAQSEAFRTQWIEAIRYQANRSLQHAQNSDFSTESIKPQLPVQPSLTTTPIGLLGLTSTVPRPTGAAPRPATFTTSLPPRTNIYTKPDRSEEIHRELLENQLLDEQEERIRLALEAARRKLETGKVADASWLAQAKGAGGADYEDGRSPETTRRKDSSFSNTGKNMPAVTRSGVVAHNAVDPTLSTLTLGILPGETEAEAIERMIREAKEKWEKEDGTNIALEVEKTFKKDEKEMTEEELWEIEEKKLMEQMLEEAKREWEKEENERRRKAGLPSLEEEERMRLEIERELLQEENPAPKKESSFTSIVNTVMGNSGKKQLTKEEIEIERMKSQMDAKEREKQSAIELEIEKKRAEIEREAEIKRKKLEEETRLKIAEQELAIREAEMQRKRAEEEEARRKKAEEETMKLMEEKKRIEEALRKHEEEERRRMEEEQLRIREKLEAERKRIEEEERERFRRLEEEKRKRDEDEARAREQRRIEDEKRRQELDRIENERRRLEEEERRRLEERKRELEEFERMKRESEISMLKWREEETRNRAAEKSRYEDERKLSDNEESEASESEEEEEEESKSESEEESDGEKQRTKKISTPDFPGKEEMIELIENVGGSVKLIIKHFNTARSRSEAEFRGHDKSCKAIAELTRKNLSTNLSKIFLHQFRVDSRATRKYHFWDAIEATTEVDMFSNEKNIDFYKAVSIITRDYQNNNLRFRNLVCRGLNEHVLHRWILIFARNEAVTARFYAPRALLRCPPAVRRLCEILAHLADSDLPFRLTLDYEGRF